MPIRPRARVTGGDRALQFVEQALAARKPGRGVRSIEVGFRGPVAKKAAFNEFGTADIPERPFFRKAISRIRAGEITPLIKAAVDRQTMTVPPAAATEIGRAAASVVKSSIDRTDSPPNAPGTIRQKGKDDPLVDGGEMRRGVKHRRLR